MLIQRSSRLPVKRRSTMRVLHEMQLRCVSLLLLISAFNVPSNAYPRPYFIQNVDQGAKGHVSIRGKVVDKAGEPISDASVQVEWPSGSVIGMTKSNAAGEFEFDDQAVGQFQVRAEKWGAKSKPVEIHAPSSGQSIKVDLLLDVPRPSADTTSSQSPAQPMEFADKPEFAIAGVTDWTAAGGHGSDSSLRTSEDLARGTLSFKPAGSAAQAEDSSKALANMAGEAALREKVALNPKDEEANRKLGELYLESGRCQQAVELLQTALRLNSANRTTRFDLALALDGAGNPRQALEEVKELLSQGNGATWYSLAGELYEKLGDPLSAVHEYQQAAGLSPTETNLFNWGSELLLHRAIWQAQEVFQRGAQSNPNSARMLAALGSALFAGARYDESAQQFCRASDLDPNDDRLYEFMGKIEIAAPNREPCIRLKLAAFVEAHPDNSLGNYFYAMSLWKEKGQSATPDNMRDVERLLIKAVTLDAGCADGYFQLGNLYSSQRAIAKAITMYEKAISINPNLAEAHYRLGVAYDHSGDRVRAKREFELHDELKANETAEVERQRKEVKQFLVIVPGEPTYPQTR